MPVQLPSYPIFNLLTYLLLCAIYVLPLYKRKDISYHQRLSIGIHYKFFFIICTLFCVFAFSSGDFYGYYILFRKTVITHHSSHLEDVYIWLINNVTSVYITWRLIIWGGATILTLWSFRRYHMDAIPVFASITLFYITTLYIMRGNLGVSIMFLGITFLFSPKRSVKYIDILIGLFLIIVSYYFHKSMLLSLALLIPSLYRLSKKTITFSLCLFPVAVILMKGILAYLGENGLEGTDETISNSAANYSTTEMFQANTMGMVRNFFVYFPSYLILIYAYRSNLMQKLPYKIRFFFNYWYIWIYIASVCAFQDVGGWYYSRFMYMSNLPLAVFMAYVFQHTKYSKTIKVIIFFSFLSGLYTLAYAYYQMNIK